MADDAEKTSREDAAFMTSAMLKAYSHPLRRQILRLIARRGFLRAGMPAKHKGQQGAASYFSDHHNTCHSGRAQCGTGFHATQDTIHAKGHSRTEGENPGYDSRNLSKVRRIY
jgi:hypothetical protein